jgi:DNA-binding HxlR family transcriptional regulator
MDKNDTMDFFAYSRYVGLTDFMEPNMPSKKPMRSCPVMAFQKMISGKYKIRILWDLKDGALRYGEIKNGLLRGADGSAEIAPRVLSRELKALAQSGLIDRKDYGVVPPKVEYRLTRTGQTFIPVIDVIRRWGERHLGTMPTPTGRAAADGRLSRAA